MPSSKNEEIKQEVSKIRNEIRLGVSFSVKTCKDYSLDWQACLDGLLDAGFQRFRIMSYWDLHEPEQGVYDFSLLDSQLEIITKAGAEATLCIGMRQPRWPETHIPAWALELEIEDRRSAYLAYHRLIIERYKNYHCIQSWQLENEFWNKGFGQNNDFSRSRLKEEFSVLRALDPNRPIIMSLGNTVGLPIFAPKPDLFGTTMYLVQYENGRYSHTKFKPWYFALRRILVRIFGWRDLLIHELQAEPWGPKANWEMDDQEQALSMNSDQLKRCVQFAKDSGMKYMDLWGGEWWYWRKTTRGDHELWATVKSLVSDSRSKA
ncbi:beta-galactosidase [Candidatus Saccharibacteria bacterium]|nr:beta-galactosidase [Candidatus Saccharibacteria bacterium]